MITVIKLHGMYYLKRDNTIVLGSNTLANLLIRWSAIKKEGAH